MNRNGNNFNEKRVAVNNNIIIDDNQYDRKEFHDRNNYLHSDNYYSSEIDDNQYDGNNYLNSDNYYSPEIDNNNSYHNCHCQCDCKRNNKSGGGEIFVIALAIGYKEFTETKEEKEQYKDLSYFDTFIMKSYNRFNIPYNKL